jgi:hypothetical protein
MENRELLFLPTTTAADENTRSYLCVTFSRTAFHAPTLCYENDIFVKDFRARRIFKCALISYVVLTDLVFRLLILQRDIEFPIKNNLSSYSHEFS